MTTGNLKEVRVASNGITFNQNGKMAQKLNGASHTGYMVIS
jgi:hypothetical protein